MKKFIAVAAVGAVAIGLSLASTAPSAAFYHSHYGYGLGAGLFGFAVGAAVAGAAHDRYYRDGYYGGPGWDDHVAACASAYRTYDPHSDTYVRRIGGELVRVECDL